MLVIEELCLLPKFEIKHGSLIKSGQLTIPTWKGGEKNDLVRNLIKSAARRPSSPGDSGVVGRLSYQSDDSLRYRNVNFIHLLHAHHQACNRKPVVDRASPGQGETQPGPECPRPRFSSHLSLKLIKKF